MARRAKVNKLNVKTIPAPKVVSDPVYGIIDLHPILPMIETKEFQLLGDKRQLGMSYLTFPSATHSRKAHSIGAYHATRLLADRWLKLGLINQEEADAVAGYALYHDIGHPAFSHVTEDLCSKDNDEMSVEIIKNLKKAIEAAGINYSLLKKLASHENPLYLAVHDKNLGMEKLDYLERDGIFTILSRPAGIDYLRRHIYFIDGKMAIDEKVIDNAIEVQNFYLKMYKNVYLRKSSAIAQRMLQKIVYNMILAGEMSADDLPHITDSELIGIIGMSKNKTVKNLYDLFRCRELFREAVVIRPKHFASGKGENGKSVRTIGVTDKEMKSLMNSPMLQQKNQAGLDETENKIAKVAGVPQYAVVLVPVFNPGKFEAKDILIFTNGGKLESLKKRFPAHFKNMEEVAQSYIALRICTLEKYRKKLSGDKMARAIIKLLMNSA